MKVLSFGEVLWDVYPDNQYIGGAPLNFAAHLAKLGEESYLFSAVGEDDLGMAAIDRIRDWNVQARYISVLNTKKTGQCLVTLDQNRVPSYNLLSDVAYDAIPYTGLSDDFDVLYFGTLALRSGYNRDSLECLIAENGFADIFVDINIRPPYFSRESVLYALENATIVKISLEEMPTIADLLAMVEGGSYEGFAKALSHRFTNVKIIIITLGGDGAYALDCKTEQGFFCACAKTNVVSTVGAGDSFSAAFLHKYLQKKTIPVCLEFANKIAGIVVSKYEAIPEYVVES